MHIRIQGIWSPDKPKLPAKIALDTFWSVLSPEKGLLWWCIMACPAIQFYLRGVGRYRKMAERECTTSLGQCQANLPVAVSGYNFHSISPLPASSSLNFPCAVTLYEVKCRHHQSSWTSRRHISVSYQPPFLHIYTLRINDSIKFRGRKLSPYWCSGNVAHIFSGIALG